MSKSNIAVEQYGSCNLKVAIMFRFKYMAILQGGAKVGFQL